MKKAGWLTRWRRRHADPFDWETEAPEIGLPKPEHVRLVTQWPRDFNWRRP
jgi:hypothetical protein